MPGCGCEHRQDGSCAPSFLSPAGTIPPWLLHPAQLGTLQLNSLGVWSSCLWSSGCTVGCSWWPICETNHQRRIALLVPLPGWGYCWSLCVQKAVSGRFLVYPEAGRFFQLPSTLRAVAFIHLCVLMCVFKVTVVCHCLFLLCSCL